jgi:hypothetical protein
MDLYGSGASISQANALTQQAQQINEAASDFNNSLAEQLDQARTAGANEQISLAEKNAISIGTAGVKLLGSGAARGDVADAAKAAIKGFKSIPVSFADRVAKGGVVDAGEGASDLADSIRSVYAGGARPPSPTGLSRGGAYVQTAADVGEREAAEGSRFVGQGFRYGVESAADLPAGSIVSRLGFKSLEDVGKTGLAKGAVAGLGGVLDIGKDIERTAKGGFGIDTFGSNNYQRIGNIANIVGSGLEVAGLLTAWTPLGLGLEGIGAAIALGGSATEAVGDVKEGGEQETQTEKDVKSQTRGLVSSQQLTQAIGRTQ